MVRNGSIARLSLLGAAAASLARFSMAAGVGSARVMRRATVLSTESEGVAATPTEWLTAHNLRRKKYHAKYGKSYVPMKWSTGLASASAAYAKKLAASGCKLVHDSGNQYGENLASNSGSGSWGKAPSADSVLQRWAENEESYGGGHFTQAIWRATKYVGCGEASKQMGSSTCFVQVCRYAKPGNCNLGNWKTMSMMDDTPCGPACPPEGCKALLVDVEESESAVDVSEGMLDWESNGLGKSSISEDVTAEVDGADFSRLATVEAEASARLVRRETEQSEVVEQEMASPTEWLTAHNLRRKKYHAKYGKSYVPMKWSTGLASASAAYAKKLAASGCKLVHDSRNKYGENLASNSGSGSWGKAPSADSVLNRWAEKEESYGGGHFTQAIWRATKYVGCGEASKQMGSKTCFVQVCRYAKPGNCNLGNWKTTAMLDDTPCGPACPPEGCKALLVDVEEGESAIDSSEGSDAWEFSGFGKDSHSEDLFLEGSANERIAESEVSENE